MRPLSSYDFRSIARNTVVKAGWQLRGAVKATGVVLFWVVSLALAVVLLLCLLIEMLALKVLLSEDPRCEEDLQLRKPTFWT